MEIKVAAARFCQIIESAEQYRRDDFVVDVVPALSALVAAAAAMPLIELPEDDYEPPEIPHAVWHERFMAVGHALADWDIYWTVDPLVIDDEAEHPEMMAGSLNDDLADIWRDLKAGLLGLEAGGTEVDIRWQWRFDFYSHWGRHATQALNVLHARMHEIKTPMFRVN